jgi:hypothetical protein
MTEDNLAGGVLTGAPIAMCAQGGKSCLDDADV